MAVMVFPTQAKAAPCIELDELDLDFAEAVDVPA